ncbi:hypothetical protein BZA05DRAFT_331044 [Tricharina praecox]|uniref:uncharacterized protein n=1 Tax=Tricharina praecox TaxID=43433 RepID=UPI00221F7309|nr:uncharacterized protein BZA05DRAFT_331044 [Tricharina praecox]KAI5858024.1 hypothetical protein BZA05DRAFT_331044 [Tricharina praecox]
MRGAGGRSTKYSPDSDDGELCTRAAAPREPTSGWRIGLIWCIASVSMVFLLNLFITIWAVKTFSVTNGLGVVFEGPCAQVKTLSIWIHVLINALGTLALSGSNYAQQCLTSPTREEVDRAHAKGEWLDIGVPSVKNLRRVKRSRMVLWWFLAVTSVPLHLLYNSAAFTTIASNDYLVAVIPENTFSSEPPTMNFTRSEITEDTYYPNLNNYTPQSWVEFLAHARNWTAISPRECFIEYDKTFVSGKRNVAVVLQGNSNEGFLNGFITSQPSLFPRQWLSDPVGWNEQYIYMDLGEDDKIMGVVRSGGEWRVRNLEGQVVPVKECRAEVMDEACKLQFSALILAIVIVCNAVKVVCMTLTLFERNFIPLVTLGDAIQSFLLKPDPNTAGICYADKQYIEAQRKTGIPWNSGDLRPQPWERRPFHWRNAVSLRRWIVSVFCMCISLAAVAYLLWLAVRSDMSVYPSNTFKDIWDRGFARVSFGSMVFALGYKLPLIGAVFLANLPQTILSFLYLMYNALFTSMLSCLEWNSYANSRKPLRVTYPREGQRSSYYLQLPYRFALTLMVFSGILHWLTSQAIFLARIEVYFTKIPGTPEFDEIETLSAVCFSTMAIILALVMGALTIVVIIVMGLRKYRHDMPIPSGCSAAISAACHPPTMDDTGREEIISKPLQWGDVSVGFEEGGTGHLAFSAYPVGKPIVGKEYAGSRARRKAL